MMTSESVMLVVRGQTIDNFLARLPHLSAGIVREIAQCIQDPGSREELLDILFEWTYPVLYKLRKTAGGLDLFCEGIGLLVKRNEQTPDSPATVVFVVLMTWLIASPWILVSLPIWVFIGPVVWWRKNQPKRRVESAMKSLGSDKKVLGKPRVGS